MADSIPIKLLFETKPYIVTIETKNGSKYRGSLRSIEENMNCHLENVSLLNSKNKNEKFNSVFIRGSSILLILLPDILKEAPLLKIS
nr:small nuclear ribonucleoprotein Sm D3 [Cryptomonas sp.]